MMEAISVPPTVQGVLVVGFIFGVAMSLYIGYSLIERYAGNQMATTLEDS